MVDATEKKKKKEKPSVKQQGVNLVSLAIEQGFQLFHTPSDEPYATVPNGNHDETYRIRSATFTRLLNHLHYQQKKRAPSAQVIQVARSTFEGLAVFDNPVCDVFLRVAGDDSKILIDLCNDRWQVIEVSPAGYRVMDKSPVRFRRTRGMLPLPIPEPGGNLNDLRKYLNLGSDDDFKLNLAWAISALRPGKPQPVLGYSGEQGTAKSTNSRILRSIIDPNEAEIRSEPRDVRDLMISATNSWLIALDNLSYLPTWLSDALCRLSTGGGFSTRQLYADDDEILLSALRPVLVNGIGELAVRGDLIDRSILLTLPNISDEQRKTEREFWGEFQKERPRLFGALLDGLVCAMRNAPTLKPSRLPRMADFAVWAMASAPVLDSSPDEILEVYEMNRANANGLALESSALAVELQQWIATVSTWSGSAADLKNILDKRVIKGLETVKPFGWPNNPRALSVALRRLAPNLRAIGIEIVFDRTGGQRKIVISKHSPATQGMTQTVTQSVTQNPEETPIRDANDANDENVLSFLLPPLRNEKIEEEIQE